MPKKTKAEIEEENSISQERVQQLFEAGCPVPEAAGFFHMTADQFIKHCHDEYNIDVAIFSQIMYHRGRALIREKQYKKSLSKGDNPLLIWLGKSRLGQRDKIVGEMDAPADMIDFLQRLKEEEDGEDNI